MKKIIILTLKTIGMLVIAFLMVLIGQILGDIMVSPLTNSSNAGIQFGAMYAGFIGIWLVAIAYVLLVKKNRGLLKYLTPSQPGNNVKTALLIGLPMGIGLNLLVAIVAMINKDIAISFSTFNPLMILYFIIVVGIQSGAEEAVDRWFIYQKLREYFPKYPVVAIAGNAVFFAFLHIFNPGVHIGAIVNIAAVGILYSLMVYYYDSLWAAIVAHTTWNFCQNILLGLPNSGIVTEYSVFSLDAASARSSFAYDVNFGIEGTVLTNVLLIVACIVIIYFGRKKKQAEQAV